MVNYLASLDEYGRSMEHPEEYPCNLITNEANTGAVLVHQRMLRANEKHIFNKKTEILVLELRNTANAANSGEMQPRDSRRQLM